MAEPAVEVQPPRAPGREILAALAALDAVDLPLIFQRRAVVMQNIIFFLRGPPFRNAMSMALEEICARDEVSRTRGWKLFLLLPRLLLHKPPQGGSIPTHRLVARFEAFSQGQWATLLRESVEGAEMVATARSRRSRRSADDIAHRAKRAQALVLMWEISSGRQELEGAALVPGTEDTLNALTDRDRRPVQPVRE